jgi:hypothetical protein
MTVEVDTIETLRERAEQLKARVSSLEADREILIETARAVYAWLIEPNPANGDPAPWDLVGDEHPIREAARKVVDTLVSLGVEA